MQQMEQINEDKRYRTLTYFRKFWVPTSAAKTEPMLSAAMPDADVPRITLSRSAGSGMKALSEPSMAFPMTMPLSSPFLADGSENEAAMYMVSSFPTNTEHGTTHCVD